jgi:hypothetical protein
LALDHAFTDRAPESAFIGCKIHAANLATLLLPLALMTCHARGLPFAPNLLALLEDMTGGESVLPFDERRWRRRVRLGRMFACAVLWAYARFDSFAEC